jgi:acetyl-CoA carboxylase carboxyltransferase component
VEIRQDLLSGRAPRIAVVDDCCFAGNAVVAGCADLLVATPRASLGMGGPAMIAGGGLGEVAATDVGPLDVMTANGVVDVAVDDGEAVPMARRLLGYFVGRAERWQVHDQAGLRDAVPEGERTAYALEPIVATIADVGSVTVLRARFAPELLTALGRSDGRRTVGFVGNDTRHAAGAITADAGDKAARFLQLCDAFGFPVVSLVDTPGMMVGPVAERTGLVRHTARVLLAGARLQVPLVGVVLRRGYGLGAPAMLGGSTHAPLLTVAWPGAHLAAMGLEGAVRLAMRRELEAIADATEHEARVRELTEHARRRSTPGDRPSPAAAAAGDDARGRLLSVPKVRRGGAVRGRLTGLAVGPRRRPLAVVVDIASQVLAGTVLGHGVAEHVRVPVKTSQAQLGDRVREGQPLVTVLVGGAIPFLDHEGEVGAIEVGVEGGLRHHQSVGVRLPDLVLVAEPPVVVAARDSGRL